MYIFNIKTINKIIIDKLGDTLLSVADKDGNVTVFDNEDTVGLLIKYAPGILFSSDGNHIGDVFVPNNIKIIRVFNV